MLAALDVRYVLARHFESRKLCGETDEVVRDSSTYRHTMRAVLCVGKTTRERHRGVAEKKVRRQVATALGDRPAEVLAAAVIAYGPLWAIGTGEAATPEEAEEMCAVIRDELGQLAGAGTAAMVHIQYGGSVTAKTSEALLGATRATPTVVSPRRRAHGVGRWRLARLLLGTQAAGTARRSRRPLPTPACATPPPVVGRWT